jgi:HK97 family phage prohead protease
MERFGIVSRAAVQGNTLVGLAAVYDVPTTRQSDFPGTETIARTAFDGLLDGDVVALVNHDMNQLLGRTASGTLRLASVAEGLRMELDLPDTQLGHDVRELVKRGDLAGMSFSATLGEVERTKAGVVHRKFKALHDVAVVTSPAYRETSVAVRSAGEQSLAGQLAVIRHRIHAAKGKANDRG